MADERFVLPSPPKPDPTEYHPHPLRVRLDVVALAIACLAALFSYLQWRAENKQAQVAEKALDLARSTSDDQAKDVARSRKAAEDSVAFAKALAETALRGLKISERSARAAELSAAAGRDALAVSRATSKLVLRPNIRAMGHLEATTPVVRLTNIGPVPAVYVTAELFRIGLTRTAGSPPIPGLTRVSGEFPSYYLPVINPQTAVILHVDKETLASREVMGYSEGSLEKPYFGDIIQLTVRYYREADGREYGGAQFYFRTPEGTWVRENTNAFPRDILQLLTSRDWPQPDPDFDLHPFQQHGRR